MSLLVRSSPLIIPLTMKQTCGCLVLLLLLLLGASPMEGSLLPFLSRGGQGNQQQELELRYDPFKILEQIPFGLERDDYYQLYHQEVSPVRVDWKESPQAHSIIMDVPGLKREDLKIEVGENRVLRVSGERMKEEKKEQEHWHRVERSYGKFWRQFRLPENADLDSVQAYLQEGVLTITLPKLSPDKIKGPKLVQIDQSKLIGTDHDHAKQEL